MFFLKQCSLVSKQHRAQGNWYQLGVVIREDLVLEQTPQDLGNLRNICSHVKIKGIPGSNCLQEWARQKWRH